MVGGHGQRQPGLAGDGVQQALQGRAQGGPVPMILLGFDPLVARKPGQIFLRRAGSRELRRQPANAHIVPGHDAVLHPLRPQLAQDVPGGGLGAQVGGGQHLGGQVQRRGQLGFQRAQVQAEFDMAAAGLAGDRIGSGVEPQFAAGQPDAVVELFRRVVPGGQVAQQLAQIPEFAHLFGAQAVGVKIEGQVDDAPRLDPVPQYRNPRQGDGFQRQVGGGGGQVGQGQAGQRGQRLGAVRRLLPGVQFPLLLLQRGAVGLGPGRGLPSEALGLGLAAGLAGGVARGQHRLGLVRVLEEDAPQQVLKVALAHLGAQAVEQVTHLQVRFRLAAVQPAFQRLHTQAHARRVGAEIPHPHLELPPGQGGFQLGAVDALPGQAAQFVKNRLLGSGRVFGVEVGDLHLQPGLGHAVVHPQHQVPGQLAGQNRPAQRGFVVPGQHLGQHPGGHQRLAVGVAAQHKAVAQAGAAGLLGLAGHLVLDALHAAVHRGL